MRYSNQLDDQFKRLGFLNYKSFLPSAVKSFDNSVNDATDGNPGISYSMCDLDTDEEGIGYFFVVKHDVNIDKWEIQSIRASFQMETERRIEGVMLLEKEYSLQDGQLPIKTQLRQEVLELIKAEKLYERLYILKNGRNTLRNRFRGYWEEPSLNIYDLLNHHRSTLQKEFSKLGFSFEKAQINLFVDNRKAPEITIVEYPDHLPSSINGLLVQFKIDKLPGLDTIYIESIEASLFSNMPENAIVQKSFVLPEEFPSKEKMLKELIELYKAQKVKEKFSFKIDQSKSNSEQIQFKKRL